MGMLSVAGAVAKKKTKGLFARKKERVDMNLPFGLMIGSRVSVSVIEMLKAARDFPKLQFQFPDTALYVRFYGVISDAGFTIHRFYLAAQVTDQHPAYMLQVLTDREGDLVEGECKLFQSQREVTPDREDDSWREGDSRYNEANWKWWLEEQHGIIGIEMFDDPEAEGLRYYREDAWGTQPWVAPRRLKEKVYFDPYGESDETFVHQSMFYYRPSSIYDHLYRDDVQAADDAPTSVPDDAPVEWCIVSNIEHVIDGTRMSYIELFKGLSVQPGDLTVA